MAERRVTSRLPEFTQDQIDRLKSKISNFLINFLEFVQKINSRNFFQRPQISLAVTTMMGIKRERLNLKRMSLELRKNFVTQALSRYKEMTGLGRHWVNFWDFSLNLVQIQFMEGHIIRLGRWGNFWTIFVRITTILWLSSRKMGVKRHHKRKP